MQVHVSEAFLYHLKVAQCFLIINVTSGNVSVQLLSEFLSIKDEEAEMISQNRK